MLVSSSRDVSLLSTTSKSTIVDIIIITVRLTTTEVSVNNTTANGLIYCIRIGSKGSF